MSPAKKTAPKPPKSESRGVTREVWLWNLVDQLRPVFEKAGYPIPGHVHISMGFPSTRALATVKKRIGECWDRAASMDGTHHIFISPVLHDGLRAAGVVVHELLHAALPSGAGHKQPFVAGMKALGMIGKPTATEESPELAALLEDIISRIGPYPHAGLNPSAVAKKKQTTRMLKVACPSGQKDYTGDDKHTSYIARMTRKVIDEHGTPICPVCGSQLDEDV